VDSPRHRQFWYKSTYSDKTECIEVAFWGDQIQVRDSKAPGPRLTFGRRHWAAFVSAIRQGAEFDAKA